MKHNLLAAFALISLFISAPALAVSEDDINRLFNNPPPADGPNINHLFNPPLAATAQLDTIPLPPRPMNVALTTTNPPARSNTAPAVRNGIDPQLLENRFEISYDDAEAAISAALAQKGIADKIGAMMDGHKKGSVFAYSQPLRIETRGLQFDKTNGRWSASLLFVAEDETVISALPASGHFNEMMEVPVLKRQLRNGDIIAEGDVELRDFVVNRTRPDTVSDIASLIGKTPVRGVSPFRPIRENEIANMPIVKRDAIVQISYSIPGMEITTSGQALAPGARGDVIEVRNTTSKKVVRAVIASSDRVQVIVPNMQTSQLMPTAATTGIKTLGDTRATY